MSVFFITGGAGFIGFCLSKKLLEEGHTIIGIDNFMDEQEDYYREHWNKLKEHKNFIGIENDICWVDSCDVCEIMEEFKIEKIDGIFHLAAMARIQKCIEEPLLSTDTNIMGTINLLELCKELNIPRLVYSSSSNVYGEQEGIHSEEKSLNAQNPYAIQKMASEYFCKFYNDNYDVRTISLRYFNVTGPEQSPHGEYALLVPKFCLKALKEERLPIYGDGSKTRAFVHVNDVVSANILAMTTTNQECFGQAFNICGDKSVSVQEVTNKILEITQSKSKIVYLPDKIGETQFVNTINKKAKEMLGWNTSKDIDETLKDCVDFFREKYIK